MKILIDTNVLISAALYPKSVTSLACDKAISPPHQAILCPQNLSEISLIFNKKFPLRLSEFQMFLMNLLKHVSLVPCPSAPIDDNEELIRHESDRLIYRAARAADADMILTGDRDFLGSGITFPRAVTPSDFLTFSDYIQ